MDEQDRRRDLSEFAEAVSYPASRAASSLRARMRPRTRVLRGVEEVRSRWLLIVQASLAAGLAYWFAKDVLGHSNPFFAPMAAFISLNVMTRGPRLKHSMEIVVGVTLGVGVGDLIIGVLGSGVWQLTVGVFVAMMIGVSLGRGPLVVNQAASSAVLIATIMPPGSGPEYERMVDALVGGGIGILVMALIPRNPVNEARRSIARVVQMESEVLYDIAQGLRDNDISRMNAALQAGRASQGDITAMNQTVADGRELVKFSPMRMRKGGQLRTFNRIVAPVDNSMRNTRVLARRAIIAAEDHITVSPELIYLVESTADCVYLVRRLMDKTPDLRSVPVWGELPSEPAADGIPRDVRALLESGQIRSEDVIREFRRLAAAMKPDVVEGASLSEQVIFAQCRSVIVDMLQVCGLSRESAAATLPPTSAWPAVPPEVWDEDGE